MLDLTDLKRHLIAGTRIDPDCVPESGPVILPDGMTLADTEPFQQQPSRHRGRYTTQWPGEFLAYVADNANGEENPHCFVDDDSRSAPPTAIVMFDFGDPMVPRWREHQAKLAVGESDAFAALRGLVDRNLAQEHLLEFIDDWAGNCDFQRPDGTAINPAVARTEFADLTVEAVKNLRSKQADFARERSAVERMSMGSGLPNRLHFTCEPWKGLGAKRITARIAAADTGGALALRLNLIGWPIVRQELVDALVEMLSAAPITVRRGGFDPGLRPFE